MKNIFRKVATIAGSALMIGATAAMAAAAAYPAPFVQSGAANVAVVYGGTAAVSDVVGAANIGSELATELAAQTASGSTGATVTGGDAWQAGTSSDDLEMGEALSSIVTYIDDEHFSLLTSEEIVNSKGTAKYDQYLYFHDAESSNVTYAENDDDVVGDFFKIQDGQNIARYVMSFTSYLKSDITSAGVLDDIQDEVISIMGKSYTITTATNDSDGDVSLTLVSGANQGTISSGEELSLGGYTISATVSGTSAVEFTVDGTPIDEMAVGEIEPIAGTTDYLAVTDIDYESFAGGLHQATFWIGADKLVLTNSSTGGSVEVNAESITGATVTISSSESSGDTTISEIAINLTAQDDYFVPVNGKLSDAIDAAGDDVGILIGKNWDIEFKGFEAVDTNEVKIDLTDSDRLLELTYTNLAGDTQTLPVVYSNGSGLFAGKESGKRFILAPGSDNITDDSYFAIATADPVAAGNNAKTYVVQYKGSDKTNPDDSSGAELTLDVLGVGTQKLAMDESTSLGDTLVTLTLGGATFTFVNETSCADSNCEISLKSTDYSDGLGTNGTAASVYLRTESNALINITDLNMSTLVGAGNDQATDGIATGVNGEDWVINITVDDTSKDDDDLTLPEMVYFAQFDNGTDTTDMEVTVTKSPAWISDPEDNNHNTYRTQYGALIDEIDGDDSPSEVTITLPDSIIKPLVYVSSGELVVSTGSAGTSSATELGAVTVEDSEVASVAAKNLIVVGGSCVNTVASELLDNAACGESFTTASGIAAGEAIIKSFDRNGKVALLVAGFNAADTTKAITYLNNNAVDTTVGAALKVTSATEATAMVA